MVKKTKQKNTKKTTESKTPKISVVMPVYNTKEEYLREAVDSILNQTFTDFEFIIVNDGSTNKNVERIIKSYKDNRIKIIKQKNQGAGIAKNKGIDAALGEYIGFIDSDDWVSPDYFKSLYNLAKKYDADISATGTLKTVFEDKNINKNIGISNNGILKTFDQRSIILSKSAIATNKIYRKKFLDTNNICMSEISSYGEDFILSALSVVKSNKIATTVRPIYYYRQHENSTTNKHYTEKTFSVIDTYRESIDRIKKDKSFDAKYMGIVIQKIHDSIMKDYYPKFEGSLKHDFLKTVKDRLPELNIQKTIPYFNSPLIISLTTFPPRIGTVYKTIETLLNQTKKADKVILWLADSEFPKKEKELPQKLLNLKKKGLIINWCENIKSYKKLIPTLIKYPNAIIITADDDVTYPIDFVEQLYNEYLEKPDVIICNRIRRIIFKNKQNLAPYKKWPIIHYGSDEASYLNLFTGIGGVLYFPNCFYKDILRKDLFMKLAPHGDDIWFWAMACLAGHKIKRSSHGLVLENIPDTQECGLWHENSMGRNDLQIKAVLKHYPKLFKILKKEYKSKLYTSLIKIRHKPGKIIYRLFGIFPLMLIREKTNKEIYRLFGIIPIWKKRIKE